jgi:carboxylesterase type B
MVSLKIEYTVLLALLFHTLNVTAPVATLPLNNTTYIGTSTNNVDTFLEIPYGQDPNGQNRFAPPKPFVPAPNTTFNVTLSGPACPQQVGVAAPATIITDISEDCLKLRISRPSFANATSGFPVMVWIYGGENCFS